MLHLGKVKPESTLYIPFNTYDSNGQSVTLTGLAVGDIKIYKNGGTTERVSTSGYTLLDTDGIDFDGLTGIHGVSIDLSDNGTAGFYEPGYNYWVVISDVTVDSQTVRFVAATFDIGTVNALQEGIAAGGTASSITLNSLADGTNSDIYKYCIVAIVAGTGAGQSRLISAYNNSTKVATVDGDFDVTPTTSSVYAVLPFGGVTVSAAEINTQLLDVMNTDTITLPGQESPPNTPTAFQMLAWLYKNFRNKKEQTNTEYRLYNDAGTVIDSKATVSDNGTTATKEEMVTGP